MIDIQKTAIKHVLVIAPQKFEDHRGFFRETWNQNSLKRAGINLEFSQDNQSISFETNTIRGLHFQTPPHQQAKLVRCGQGAFLDVAVDIRRGSPSYGAWVSMELSAENGKQMLIPAGFAHGFRTLMPNTEILYKCTAAYAPECDRAIRFDDPDIGIEWGISRDLAIISEKDANAAQLSECGSPFTWDSSQ